MKNVFLLLLVLNMCVSVVYADNGKLVVGSRYKGMADMSVSISDFWACSNNQAALGFYKHYAVGLYYENRYLLKNMSSAALGIVLPFEKVGVFSADIQFVGGSGFNTTKIGIAYSRAFGEIISASLQFDYLLNYFGDAYYGHRSGFTFEVGMYGKVTKNFFLGFHVYNPAHLKMITYNDIKEYIPTVFKFGGSYIFSKKCLVGIDLIKSLDTKLQIATGIEYIFGDYLTLRGGIRFPDFQCSVGVGTKFKALHIDFASSYHALLGYSPQISLCYDIK